jgi:hypothetical protein
LQEEIIQELQQEKARLLNLQKHCSLQENPDSIQLKGQSARLSSLNLQSRSLRSSTIGLNDETNDFYKLNKLGKKKASSQSNSLQENLSYESIK